MNAMSNKGSNRNRSRSSSNWSEILLKEMCIIKSLQHLCNCSYRSDGNFFLMTLSERVSSPHFTSFGGIVVMTAELALMK